MQDRALLLILEFRRASGGETYCIGTVISFAIMSPCPLCAWQWYLCGQWLSFASCGTSSACRLFLLSEEVDEDPSKTALIKSCALIWFYLHSLPVQWNTYGKPGQGECWSPALA